MNVSGGSTGNTLIKNQATDNTEIGLHAYAASPGTLLVQNTLCGNGLADLYAERGSEPIVKKSNEICVFG